MLYLVRSWVFRLGTGVGALLLAGLFLFPGSLHAAEQLSANGTAFPNDPYWQRQWYLRQIQAPEAWRSTTGSASVIVAVLDTGIDITHPDIKENIWTNIREIPGDGIDNDRNGYVDDVHGWNFMKRTGDVQPTKKVNQSREAWNHGTAVASLIGARGQDGIGMAGVAWNVRIMPLVVLDADGSGSLDGLLAAIRYAVSQGASVINLSLAGFDYDEQLDQLVRRAAQAGVLMVVATGNDTRHKAGLNVDETPTYPACMDGNINAVLGVSGTDTLDQKAPYANYGKTCTDLSAPAQDLFVARPVESQDQSAYPGYVRGMTGTSLAAPLVSGVAALIKSLEPTWTGQQIRDRLLSTADPIEGATTSSPGRLGYGRLNAARAVQGLGVRSIAAASMAVTSSTKPAATATSSSVTRTPVVKNTVSTTGKKIVAPKPKIVPVKKPKPILKQKTTLYDDGMAKWVRARI